MTTSGAHRHGTWSLAASQALLCLLVAAAVAVGAYAVANPNGIEFGAPVPAFVEALAAIAGLALAGGVSVRRRGGGGGALVLGVALAVLALVSLAYLAFVLSFNQL